MGMSLVMDVNSCEYSVVVSFDLILYFVYSCSELGI